MDGFYAILTHHWGHDAGSQPDHTINSSDDDGDDDEGGEGGTGEAVPVENRSSGAAPVVSETAGGSDEQLPDAIDDEPASEPAIDEAAAIRMRIAALKNLSCLLLSFC